MARENAEATWHLPSNRGNHTVTFALVFRDEATDIWIHHVEFAVENWSRPGVGDEKRLEADVQLSQVVLRKSGLTDLVRSVESWLSNRQEFRVNIAGEDQLFEIEISQRQDLISSRDKPSCSVRYKWGASVGAECAFIVDESCLRILQQELRAALGGV